jgi:hypothetical protein
MTAREPLPLEPDVVERLHDMIKADYLPPAYEETCRKAISEIEHSRAYRLEMIGELERRPPSAREEALSKAAEQFRFYEREHLAKAASAPDEREKNIRTNKAILNREYADLCERALGGKQ